MRRIILFVSAALACVSLSAQTMHEKTAVENGVVEVVKQLTLGTDPTVVRSGLLELAAKDSTDDAVQYYLGICELMLGNTASAEDALQKACALDPSNDEYKEVLARVFAGTGRVERATDIYLSLLEKSPGKYRGALTLTMLAERNMYERNDSLALANFDAALLYDPSYSPAILGKAEVYRIEGNLAAFFSQLGPYVSNPDCDSNTKCRYLNELTNRLDGRTYQVWHTQIDSLIAGCVSAHPGDSSALNLAGRWFYGTGDKVRGEKYFDDFLRLYPDCAEPHYIHLSLLIERDDLNGVIEECRNLLAIAGNDKAQMLTALGTMGDSYQKLGDNASAYSCYERALKLDPEYLPVLNNYAYFLCLENKRLARAEKMSRITIDKEPDNATYLDTYGWILHLRGKDKEAKPFFKHAMLYGGKENKEVLYHYSVVLEALGERELSSYYRGLSENKE